jgi:hypothetical protein
MSVARSGLRLNGSTEPAGEKDANDEWAGCRGGEWGGGGQFNRKFVPVKPAGDCEERVYFEGVVGGSQGHVQKCIF